MPLCLLFGFENVHFFVISEVFIHHCGDVRVLGNESRWSAEIVTLRQPEKVEQEQVLLARKEPHAASHHLLIEAPHFGGAQNYDAVHSGTVPTFCKEHGVAQHVIHAILELCKDFRAIIAHTVDFRRPQTDIIQHSAEFLRGGNERQEHHGLSAPAVTRHFVCDLM